MQVMVYLLLSRWWAGREFLVLFSAKIKMLTSMVVRAWSVQCVSDLLGDCRDESQCGAYGAHRERAAVYDRKLVTASLKENFPVQDSSNLTLETTEYSTFWGPLNIRRFESHRTLPLRANNIAVESQ